MKTKRQEQTNPVEIDPIETHYRSGHPTVTAGALEGRDEHLPKTLIEAKAAYEEVEQMLLSLEAGKLKKVRLDGTIAADTALGSVRRIEPFRRRIAALPESDASDVDLLRKLVGAVLWTQTRIAKESDSGARALAEAGFEHRTKLDVAARPLLLAGLMDPDWIEPVSKSRGYRVVAADLLALAQAYDDAWPKVAGKTTVTWDDVERAVAIHDELVDTLVAQEAGGEDPGAPDSRQMLRRALVRLQECYRRLRKAMDYLCDSDREAAQIMPSLRQGDRKRKEAEAKQTSPDAAVSVERVSAERTSAATAASERAPPTAAPVPAVEVPASTGGAAPAEEPAVPLPESGAGPVASGSPPPGSSNGNAGCPFVGPS